ELARGSSMDSKPARQHRRETSAGIVDRVSSAGRQQAVSDRGATPAPQQWRCTVAVEPATRMFQRARRPSSPVQVGSRLRPKELHEFKSAPFYLGTAVALASHQVVEGKRYTKSQYLIS